MLITTVKLETAFIIGRFFYHTVRPPHHMTKCADQYDQLKRYIAVPLLGNWRSDGSTWWPLSIPNTLGHLCACTWRVTNPTSWGVRNTVTLVTRTYTVYAHKHQGSLFPLCRLRVHSLHPATNEMTMATKQAIVAYLITHNYLRLYEHTKPHPKGFTVGIAWGSMCCRCVNPRTIFKHY